MLALRERGVFVKQEKKKIVILIKKKLLFREKASFTVEASLIMMTVLMAVFMCIYYGFFTHDKAVLEEVSWHTAQKAMLLVTENSSMKDGAFSWEELQEKGLLWRISQNVHSPFIDYIVYYLSHLICQMMVKFCIKAYNKIIPADHIYVIGSFNILCCIIAV